MRIRTRLLIVVLAVWLSAAAGFGLLAWNLHEQKTTALLDQVKDAAETVNKLVERELDQRVVLARTLASSKAARDGDFVRFHEEATAATRATTDWVVVASQDSLLLNTLSSPDSPAVARTMPRPLADTSPSFAFVPLGPVSKKAVVTVLVPIPGATPQKYNVGVSFEPSQLQRLLDPSSGSAAGLTTVIDDHQLIIARSRDPAKWVGRTASPAFKSRIQSEGFGFAESVTLDGVASLTYLTRPNAHGWSVVSAIPKADLSAGAWRASSKAVVASGVFLVFLLGIALYAARVFSVAVQQLSQAAEDLGDNKVPTLHVMGVPEFDRVGAALHAAGVKALDATATLERRVEQAVHETAEAQTKLAHKNKLELVGRMTAGVAHDFNNLLQTISVAHQLLQRRVSTDAEQRALAGAIRATSKAASLIKQLMLLGRTPKLEPSLVNLADVVLKEHELTSKTLGSKVMLSAEIDTDLPLIFVDPVQLEMALLNLVFNARDALPSGGRIAIRARLATPEESQAVGAGSFIRIDVADDGVGMTEETIAKALEPFFTTKAPGAGTGMGLAQVHAFVGQSGGRIGLESRPGQGTCVTLYLPAASRPTAAAPGETAELPLTGAKALNVLMVEDDLLVASVVMTALEGRGCRVQLAKDADEAIRLLSDQASFDVLFTDVVMPGSMNGIELAEWTRIHRPELAVVVATGYADNVDSLSVPVIRKPYAIDAAHRLLQDTYLQHMALSG